MPFNTNHVAPRPRGGGIVFLPEVVSSEKRTKKGVQKIFNISQVAQNKELPDFHSTDLDLVLRSGLPLESISSIMVKPNSVDVASVGIELPEGEAEPVEAETSETSEHSET